MNISVYLFSTHSGLYRVLRTWLDHSDNLDIVHLIIVRWERDKGYDLLLTSSRCGCVGVKGTLQGLIVFQVVALSLVHRVTNIYHLSLTCHKGAHLFYHDFETWCIKLSGERWNASRIKKLQASQRRGYCLNIRTDIKCFPNLRFTGTLDKTSTQDQFGCCDFSSSSNPANFKRFI